MSKTGILTFSRALNYGSTLQAWALSKVLKDIGADPEILDYEPKGYWKIYALFRFPTDKFWVAYDALHLIMLPYFLRRKRDFQRFWDRYYPKTNRVLRTPKDLREYERNYKSLICGSDQIWNTQAKDFDEQYMFPDLEDIRKISYAVSINAGQLEDNVGNRRRWLNSFYRLSVREPNSQDQLKKMLGVDREVKICLDPTLLLRAEDFNSIMAPPITKEPYIFFYSLRTMDIAMKSAERLSKETGMPIYTVIAGPGSPFYLKHWRTIRLPKEGAGPDMFLSLIGNASYVVTDSFHGTAFSIIFHRPFFAIARVSKGGEIEKDVRINNLLSLVQLTNRYVPADKIQNYIEEKIDWKHTENLRMEEAAKSKAFLYEALWDKPFADEE